MAAHGGPTVHTTVVVNGFNVMAESPLIPYPPCMLPGTYSTFLMKEKLWSTVLIAYLFAMPTIATEPPNGILPSIILTNHIYSVIMLISLMFMNL